MKDKKNNKLLFLISFYSLVAVQLLTISRCKNFKMFSFNLIFCCFFFFHFLTLLQEKKHHRIKNGKNMSGELRHI